MKRVRLTQIFPILIPLRVWQRTKLYHLEMSLDKNKYSNLISKEELPLTIYKHKSLLLRKLGDTDMQLQYNKVVNLKLCAEKIDHIIIKPGEVFSFWYLVGTINRKYFKDGILLQDGKATKGKGGGICQLGNLLYWMILHTPLTVIERHRHSFDPFPDYGRVIPFGTGATLADGWLDLKFRNDTDINFQLKIYFDENYIYGKILADKYPKYKYHVREANQHFVSRKEGNYRCNEIIRESIDRVTGLSVSNELLYKNDCLVVYDIDSSIEIINEIN